MSKIAEARKITRAKITTFTVYYGSFAMCCDVFLEFCV